MYIIHLKESEKTKEAILASSESDFPNVMSVCHYIADTCPDCEFDISWNVDGGKYHLGAYLGEKKGWKFREEVLEHL